MSNNAHSTCFPIMHINIAHLSSNFRLKIGITNHVIIINLSTRRGFALLKPRRRFQKTC
jgi:hypothetical protein